MDMNPFYGLVNIKWELVSVERQDVTLLFLAPTRLSTGRTQRTSCSPWRTWWSTPAVPVCPPGRPSRAPPASCHTSPRPTPGQTSVRPSMWGAGGGGRRARPSSTPTCLTTLLYTPWTASAGPTRPSLPGLWRAPSAPPPTTSPPCPSTWAWTWPCTAWDTTRWLTSGSTDTTRYGECSTKSQIPILPIHK